MSSERIILGIDPGTKSMGFGIINASSKKPELIDMGVYNFDRLKDPYLKLEKIFKSTIELFDKYHPDELAIEAPFFG